MASKKEVDQETRQIIYRLAAAYGVGIRFLPLKTRVGNVSLSTRTINISSLFNRSLALSAFFHELGHIHCLDHGLFPAYHRLYIRSWRQVRALRITALRAELWVDRWGEREFNRLVRGDRYDRCYRDKRTRHILSKFCQSIDPKTSRG